MYEVYIRPFRLSRFFLENLNQHLFSVNGIPQHLVSFDPLLKHFFKHRKVSIHVIINPDFLLILVISVQSTCVVTATGGLIGSGALSLSMRFCRSMDSRAICSSSFLFSPQESFCRLFDPFHFSLLTMSCTAVAANLSLNNVPYCPLMSLILHATFGDRT